MKQYLNTRKREQKIFLDVYVVVIVNWEVKLSLYV